MIIDIEVRKCMVTANGAAMFDTISEPSQIQLNTDNILLLVNFSQYNYPNTDFVIMNNNNGYIIEKGLIDG